MTSPRWLTVTDAPDAFPPAGEALTEPNGLLAMGGDLSPQRLLAAYTQGIFPWYELGQPILVVARPASRTLAGESSRLETPATYTTPLQSQSDLRSGIRHRGRVLC
jgi:Leu/Phe-tRNA-protein transferase